MTVTHRSDQPTVGLVNARLIAAAPDLLEALTAAANTIAVLKTFCDVPLTVIKAAETEGKIDAAIAQATGEKD